MKKLILANCLLAIAVIFTYCAKPDLKEELSTVNTTDAASNRGNCTLTCNPSNAAVMLTICGTNLNLAGCKSCIGEKKTGVNVFQGGLFNLNLTTPIEFSISNNAIPTALNLSAGNGSLPTIAMPANSCFRFRINDDCTMVQL